MKVSQGSKKKKENIKLRNREWKDECCNKNNINLETIETIDASVNDRLKESIK